MASEAYYDQLALKARRDRQTRMSPMIDNYIYLYHTQTLIVLPVYPESITDSMSASFTPTSIMGRSAPIYSYSNSGPRTVGVSFALHRDMMNAINYQTSNAKVEIGDDYVDTMIKQLQAMAVPKYSASERMVNPPVVALRIGDDIFCKGIVNGAVQVTYGLPIIEINGKDKYAMCTVSFTVTEIQPYGADEVMKNGSFRGLSTTLERNIWKVTGSRL